MRGTPVVSRGEGGGPWTSGQPRNSASTCTAGGRAWILLAYALDAIAIAGQAITGRYLGAGDVAGARAATNRMIGWGVACGAVSGALLACWPAS